MEKLITILLLSFGYYKACATISINIISPTTNQVSNSLLLVQVTAQSTYEITSATASVNGKQVVLVFDSSYSPNGNFNGNLLLSGLPKGIPLKLTIMVIDVFNNQQTSSVNFIYAPPPVVDIIYPLDQSNAYPSLPIKATCIGVDSCTLNVTVNFNYDSQVFLNNNYINAVDTIITFTPIVPGYGFVFYTVTDKWGQVGRFYTTVFFDNNPLLREIFNGIGTVFDFNYNKVLDVDSGRAKIIDVTTKASTTIVGEQAYLDNSSLSFLTPYGAIYGQNLNAQVFDWNNDSLYYTYDAETYLHTVGQYATLNRTSSIPPFSPELHLRNLATRIDTIISATDGDDDNSVAANGVVAFAGLSGHISDMGQRGIDIYKYANGVTTDISNDAGYVINSGPVTDGTNVVYLKTPDNLNYSIHLNTGVQDTVLSSFGPYYDGVPNPLPLSYQANNKYVAYGKSGTSGQTQIWLRDSMGVNSEVTFFGSSSTIELLDSSGDIMFINSGERYLAKRGISQPIDVGPQTGKLYYRDSSWYVTEGRYLYKLLVNAYVTINDGDWNNPSTWRGNIVPGANADVIVENNVTVSSNETCNTLKVVSPGSITVLTGFNLTVLH